MNVERLVEWYGEGKTEIRLESVTSSTINPTWTSRYSDGPLWIFFNLRLRNVWYYVYGDVQRDRRRTELASNRDPSPQHCIAAVCIALSRKTLAINQPIFRLVFVCLRVCKWMLREHHARLHPSGIEPLTLWNRPLGSIDHAYSWAQIPAFPLVISRIDSGLWAGLVDVVCWSAPIWIRWQVMAIMCR